MKNKTFVKSSVTVLLAVLIAAMTLLCGCTTEQPTDSTGTTTTTTASSDNGNHVLGEGKTAMAFTVTFLDGTSKQYTVKTDKTTVGAALLEVGLIAGSESRYGLMVDTVDGVKLDYEADGAYWAFYIDGEYAMTGADSTDIEADKAYGFTATSA